MNLRVLALSAALFVVAGLSVPVVRADPASEASVFIETLAEDTVRALTVGEVPRSERISRFRVLFNDHFAVEAMAKWVLGRHWRRADAPERAEYLRLFVDYIVASFVDRFAEYAGEKLHITKAIADDGISATVFSEIRLPGGSKTPARVNWRLDGVVGDFKIVDVVVEGVSMSTTMRSDFGSIIRREGGKLAGLLAVLRKKTETLRTAN
ncbi:MAG: ABC transporter substrate-binding protein [Rhodospirillales bacterium]|jgi:phospholipid transport system substrate-binding protein|nr:ABC transporter substrate-binding protein [Rhodospirillales bacterium]